ncbi:MAG: M48 family metallopeptidase [Oscillospiraceae bacterium]|nr:M48 family metallopeptidase [Oscillospiraceae bacterium]
MKTITLPDGRTLTYELTRKRVKNINFRAKEDSIVYISANPRVTTKEIENFLIQRADFFLDAFDKLRERENKSSINTKSVNWLGREYPVRIIQNAREIAVFDEVECRVFTSEKDNNGYILSLIQREINERFPELCREINAEVRAELAENGLSAPPTQITIKDMKTRWGSCSYTRGHISINIRLAAYPRETVKSVFWHEYAHYWHHDHSRAFYEFLERYYPEYYKWNNLLKG